MPAARLANQSCSQAAWVGRCYGGSATATGLRACLVQFSARDATARGRVAVAEVLTCFLRAVEAEIVGFRP